MLKNTLVCLSLAGLFIAGAAFAEDKAKTEAGATTTSAAPSTCTQADLTAMITKAGTLTDKDKQKIALGHLDLAKKSMDLKDMDGCAMHMKSANTTLGTVTK